MVTGDKDRNSQLLNKKAAQLNTQDGKSEQFRSCVASPYSVQSTPFVENVVPLSHISHIGSEDSEHLLALSHPRMDHANNLPFVDGSQLIRKPNELSLGLEDLVIPWTDLDLREKIGAGISVLVLEETFCAFPSQMNFSLLYVGTLTLYLVNSGSFGTVYHADWHGSVRTLNFLFSFS